jgi:starvation-inducible DNA-binding protein
MADALKTIPAETRVKTGVRAPERVAKALCECVADTYRLIFKTHAYHWNVEGAAFYSIHKLTEEQYEEMFAAVDVMAERVRALGQLTPVTFQSLCDLSVIEDKDEAPSARAMVEDLVANHERVAHRLHAAIEIAEQARDVVTADLLTARSAFHEKAAWMLRAIVAE